MSRAGPKRPAEFRVGRAKSSRTASPPRPTILPDDDILARLMEQDRRNPLAWFVRAGFLPRRPGRCGHRRPATDPATPARAESACSSAQTRDCLRGKNVSRSDCRPAIGPEPVSFLPVLRQMREGRRPDYRLAGMAASAQGQGSRPRQRNHRFIGAGSPGFGVSRRNRAGHL